MRYFKLGIAIFVALVTTFVALIFISQAAPDDTTVVIKPSALAAQSWGFLLETGVTGTGGFITGTATPPTGSGSLQLTTPDAADGILFGTNIFTGTSFNDMSRLEYSTYRQAPVSGATGL